MKSWKKQALLIYSTHLQDNRVTPKTDKIMISINADYTARKYQREREREKLFHSKIIMKIMHLDNETVPNTHKPLQ